MSLIHKANGTFVYLLVSFLENQTFFLVYNQLYSVKTHFLKLTSTPAQRTKQRMKLIEQLFAEDKENEELEALLELSTDDDLPENDSNKPLTRSDAIKLRAVQISANPTDPSVGSSQSNNNLSISQSAVINTQPNDVKLSEEDEGLEINLNKDETYHPHFPMVQRETVLQHENEDDGENSSEIKKKKEREQDDSDFQPEKKRPAANDSSTQTKNGKKKRKKKDSEEPTITTTRIKRRR